MRYHARILRNIKLFGKDIDDLVNILLSQSVFIAIFDKTIASINHKDTFSGLCIFFVYDYHARWDTSTVEEIGGQSNNTFYKSISNNIFTDLCFSVTPKQDAMG